MCSPARFIRPFALLLAAVVLSLSACAPTQEMGASGAAPDQHDGHADQHEGHADQRDGHAADPAGPPARTTAETLAQLRAMDPARLASLHDHTDGDHAGHARELPNGVEPERIVIPAIDVDADVIELGLEPDGSLEVPADFAQTGWFRSGPQPGRVGPAVIAGHVDSRRGPAVFFRLAELTEGDVIEVHGADAELVRFVVRRVEQHPKDDFPTGAVYSGTADPELRLITCGGSFDRETRSYRDNVIVFAERV